MYAIRSYYDAALRTREYLPAEAFCEHVATLPQGEAPVDGLPLFVSGIVPEPMSLFDELATLGGQDRRGVRRGLRVADRSSGSLPLAAPPLDDRQLAHRRGQAGFCPKARNRSVFARGIARGSDNRQF